MSDTTNVTEPLPLVISIDLAGELLGCGRQAAYKKAADGALPVLPGPGRRLVPLARLEAMAGRRISAEDLKAAAARLAPKRAASLKYQRDYHSTRKALASAV